MWWFVTQKYCEMIITIRLVNTSITLHNYHFAVVMVRTFKIYSLNNFQVCNTVSLTIVTMLYMRSPELIPLISNSLYSLTNISSFSLLYSPWQPPIYFVSMSLAFFPTYKRDYIVFVLSIFFLIIAILTGVNWYLIVV